ncbi:MAG: hypothetical protein K1X53_15490 [Candidatus Sumerlaeaceae bacterium]|nr:hypothetical protein [Candidatus Sumerlaeaceae bacterium]
MNKNVVGVILIVLALALVGLYGWPKLKPYVTSPVAPAPGAGAADGMTTMPI